MTVRTIYLEDPHDPFTQTDQALIEPNVLSSKVSVDGRWLTYDYDTSGKCFRQITEILVVNGHNSLSIRRTCDVNWEEEYVGLDSRATVEVDDILELDEFKIRSGGEEE